jgi:hypothetical protein
MIPRPKKVNIRNLIWSSAHALKKEKEDKGLCHELWVFFWGTCHHLTNY